MRSVQRTQFTVDFPANFSVTFSDLPGILLATNAPLPATKGQAIAGVGLIPVGKIDTGTGRCTTDPSYYVPVTNAAFGAVMNLIGDFAEMQKLRSNGCTRYRVRMLSPKQELMCGSWTN